MFWMYILPRKLMSHWAGKLMHWELPGFLATLSIRIFARMYNINTEEAEKSLESYTSIGNFFTRKLKPGARPVGEGPVVHPADSVIVAIGEINQGQCIQAKNQTFSIEDLLVDQELAEKFKDGLYVVYYLCPTDYHRVHSTVDGQVVKAVYQPGHLWPVNLWARENIKSLFAVNERVILHFESRVTRCAMVFVGATNVGKIQLSFDSEIVGNLPSKPQAFTKKYEPAIDLQRGQEVGLFSMGSTIVMVYPKNMRLQRDDWQVFLNKSVKVGETFL